MAVERTGNQDSPSPITMEKAEVETTNPSSELVSVSDHLPPNLFLLPVAQTTLFPGMIVPFILPEGKLTRTLETVMEKNGIVGIVLSRSSDETNVATGPSTSLTGLPAEGSVAAGVVLPDAAEDADFYRYGVAAKVLKKINLPDNQISVLLTGLQRFEIEKVIAREPQFVAGVHYLRESLTKGTELEALLRSCLGQFKQISKDNPLISEEVKVALVNIDGPGKLADFMASVLIRDVKDYQSLLAAADVKERLQRLLVLLHREQEVQSLQRKIQEEITQKISSQQREFYLQEQLKSIQKELGRQSDEKTRLIDKFRTRLEGKTIRAEARLRIDEEMEKLATLPDQSSEYSVMINYLDWVTALPWGVRTADRLDLSQAKSILDEDHYGLRDVKVRILEFLAVRKLRGSGSGEEAGSILCLVGPPGTGKTSLGKSIARALGRKFFRFSVGGMRDEAEIKGHRRTYVGAMPGKMVQGLKRVGSQNPVFLIDEVDKIGTNMISGGDPSSALLEVLDPEQNQEFLDHYLDIPFDCSEVFFITTANTTDTIPSALLDRMEVIRLHGYTDNEKFQIARGHLIPKLVEKHALKPKSVTFTDVGLSHIITHYARESGVRNLEKQIGRICRKVAFRVASGNSRPVVIDRPQLIERLLGPPPFEPGLEPKKKSAGVATGLAWTQFGGEVLTIESLAVEGRGGFVLTGTLGKVMQESANLAYTYVRGLAPKIHLPRHYFERHLFHLHVPAGAIPKDGPSAGITIAASLYSLVTHRPLAPGVAMTGELTLTGSVLPVGGIKEKLLAARRANLKKVLLPKANVRDLKDVEPEIKAGLEIIPVGTMADCLKHLFPG